MNQRAKTEELVDAVQPGQAPEHKVHYGRVDVAVERRQADDGRGLVQLHRLPLLQGPRRPVAAHRLARRG